MSDLEIVHILRDRPAANGKTPGFIEGYRAPLAACRHDEGLRMFGPPNVMDRGRRGGHADGKYFFAEQRIHERGLAVVEFADHHEMKAILFELSNELSVHSLPKGLAPERG